jgi:hypothetical protein
MSVAYQRIPARLHFASGPHSVQGRRPLQSPRLYARRSVGCAWKLLKVLIVGGNNDRVGLLGEG